MPEQRVPLKDDLPIYEPPRSNDHELSPAEEQFFGPGGPPPEMKPGPKTSTIASFAVIAVAVVVIVISTIATKEQNPEMNERAAIQGLETNGRIALTMIEFGLGEPSRTFVDDIGEMGNTPVLARFAAAIVGGLDTGDGERRAEALALLDGIPAMLESDEDPGVPPEFDSVLRRAIDAPDALTESERELLELELGWSAQLLLTRDLEDTHPDRQAIVGGARQSAVVLGGLVASYLFAFVLGLGLLGMAWYRIGGGRMRLNLEERRIESSIYLEAFALFVAITAACGALAVAVPALELIAGLASMVGWILGIFWPLVRGVSWGDMRHDLGLHAGRGFFAEVGAGIVGYVAVVPIFVAGLLVMAILQALLSVVGGAGGGGEVVSHPDMVQLEDAGLIGQIIFLGLAAVLAPLLEETLFRGALFRDLRKPLRVFAAALLTGLIFAAIHPQGLLAIPPLAGLAIGFALLREWRGSLIAPMVAHAVHNGMLVVAVIAMYGQG